jgi:hypothetical protein
MPNKAWLRGEFGGHINFFRERLASGLIILTFCFEHALYNPEKEQVSFVRARFLIFGFGLVPGGNYLWRASASIQVNSGYAFNGESLPFNL